MANIHYMVNDHGARSVGLAVQVNGSAIAKQMGLSDLSEVPITFMDVVNPKNGMIKFNTEVGEGKYLSAVFVEDVYQKSGRDDNIVIVDAEFRINLEAYVGEKITADAKNPKLDNHGFVRAILSTNETLHIKITANRIFAIGFLHDHLDKSNLHTVLITKDKNTGIRMKSILKILKRTLDDFQDDSYTYLSPSDITSLKEACELKPSRYKELLDFLKEFGNNPDAKYGSIVTMSGFKETHRSFDGLQLKSYLQHHRPSTFAKMDVRRQLKKKQEKG